MEFREENLIQTEDGGAALIEVIKRYQASTGEQSLLVAVNTGESEPLIQEVNFDANFGLLVDGYPPSKCWFDMAEEIHPLQWPPTLLH